MKIFDIFSSRMLMPVMCAAIFSVAACSDWTKPEGLQYRPQSPQEQNPDAYASALAAIREYKQTVHNLMAVTMDGMSELPVARPQHLMNMPDSADFIFVKKAAGLHPSLVDEISEVYCTKGTKSLAFIDYVAIDEAWTVIEDAKVDNNQPAGTPDEAEKFFREQAAAAIDGCSGYGFDGLVISYEGNVSTDMLKAKQRGFLAAAVEWRNKHKDDMLVLRGSIRNIAYATYKELLESSNYLVVVADDISAPRQLTLLVSRALGSYAPMDRVIMEVSVPTIDSPEQKGASPQVAAQWVLDEKDNRDFTPLGMCVGNANDDYYRQDMIYRNVRQAISIMNPPSESEE